MALLLIVLLAATLRLPTLGTQSIWFDEAATWDLVRRSLGTMLGRIPDGESNPPLFYVLEWGWTRVFGDGAWGLRSLSALAGIATVLVAYAIGRRLAGRRAGLATAVLVAVNPLLVWFSQEARSYALAVLLSALALLALLRCVQDERPRDLGWWALAAALALCTHYFTAFVLVPQALWLLWRHPQRRAAVAAVAAVAATGLALLPLLLSQRGNPYEIAGTSLALRAAQLPKQLLLGYRGPLAVPLGVLGALLAAAGLWLLLTQVEWRARERAIGLVAIGLAGLALPLLAALAGADYVNARNVLPALVPLLGALGVGFAASRRGGLLLGGLCSLSLAIVIAVASAAQYQRADWAGLARALGSAHTTRALVISPANGALALRYYRPELRTLGAVGATVEEVDVIAVATASDPGKAPSLPAFVGTTLAVPGFGAPQRTRTATYAIRRYRALHGTVTVTPDPLGAARFGAAPPQIGLLRAGR